ncbi:MAG: glucosamine-6-phosphate deaminase [Sedimentisphaerales bacterium]|nr:glucosamine-6-phosphate deaminase [Sedimentisphaerales bacterium]
MNIEKITVKIFEDDKHASQAVASYIGNLISQRNAQKKPTVLGLATGHTPVNVYEELIRMHKEDKLDFSRVVTFNLDEYWPINPSVVQSYHNWMHDRFFRHINIKPENIHLPRGDLQEKDIDDYCREYEHRIASAGGIDLQILGIGRSGHVGFNEPGSARNSRTRLVRLDRITRRDAAGDFFGEENVPETAITMGLGSIFDAREICLLAFGEQKASIIRRAVEGKVSEQVAASYLQEHNNATLYLDVAAAGELTRITAPWLLGHCRWGEILKCKAVIWLAQELKKSINKLTVEDYGENGLTQLLKECGSVENVNKSVFRRLMDTVTNWPAGVNAGQKVIVFSPHPDDDVICMGGTLNRLTNQGHNVYVVYMVNGYLSVFDHDVSRYADFVRQFNNIFGLDVKDAAKIEQHIDKFLRHKKPGDTDTSEIQAIKGLIRRCEAVDAAKYCGVPEEHIYFLDMPFYKTGKVQKLSVGPEDTALVREVLERIKPDIIFAAGDMSDPHGTHRLCQQAGLAAFEQYLSEGNKSPEFWLYRGAWQEWEPHQIEMVVPFSPEELKHKRYAIFRHQSQKDRAMFPGPYDSREFWQRAEERNKTTAAIYDSLGLPDYYALEAFARYPLKIAENVKIQLET